MPVTPPHPAVSSVEEAGPPFTLRRLGVVMEPQVDNPTEAEGVFNPAAARGRDGELYLFPRLVAKGNYSRIGIARVRFNDDGEPMGVERLGVAIEPTEPYEKNPFSGGGCEDPRITYLEHFQRYVMTYTAYSARGPRIALASSRDLFTWERHGLITFEPGGPVDFNAADNKDAVLFPSIVQDPHDGQPAIGLIHRPYFFGLPAHQIIERLTQRRAQAPNPLSPRVPWLTDPERLERPDLIHASMWISYADRPTAVDGLCKLTSHYRLMSPREAWERAKVGGGAPPILTRHGWLVIYHGVAARGLRHPHLHYSAGAVILDQAKPEQVLYRSREPVLAPRASDPGRLAVDIVFPTAVDCRMDLGQRDRIDVYYGIDDRRIGVASLNVPATLPEPGEPAVDQLRDTASTRPAGVHHASVRL